MLDLENIVVIGTSHENLSLLERENFMRTRPKYIIEKLYSEKKINIEFKESKSALTRDIFDTVCAFNNI